MIDGLIGLYGVNDEGDVVGCPVDEEGYYQGYDDTMALFFCLHCEPRRTLSGCKSNRTELLVLEEGNPKYGRANEARPKNKTDNMKHSVLY